MTASVGASQAAIAASAERLKRPGPVPVVLVEGMTDGTSTRSWSAIVLGRLDGEQPPLWLRPSARDALH
jgi:hypothetical protein